MTGQPSPSWPGRLLTVAEAVELGWGLREPPTGNRLLDLARELERQGIELERPADKYRRMGGDLLPRIGS